MPIYGIRNFSIGCSRRLSAIFEQPKVGRKHDSYAFENVP